MNIFFTCILISFYNTIFLGFWLVEISTHETGLRLYVSLEENLELSAWETMK